MSGLQNLKSQSDFSEFSGYREQPDTKPLVILDLNFRIVYCNEAFAHVFGVTANGDFINLAADSEMLPLLKGFAGNKYKNLTVDINLRPMFKDEAVGFTLFIERVLIGANQFLILNFDSHEARKRIEFKINSLHYALDKGNVPVIIIDSGKKITYITKSFEDLFSKGLDKVYNQHVSEVFMDIFPAADYQEFYLSLNEYRTWKKLVAVRKRAVTEYWEFSLNPVYFAENSELVFILSAGNLTEHIRQKQHIEKSEKRQLLIIENITDLLLILDYDGSEIVFENANANFLKIFNVEKKDLRSKTIEKFLPENFTRSVIDSVNYFADNNERAFEFNYVNQDRKTYACKVSSTAGSENNRLILIISMKDITEQLVYEEQLKRAYFKEMQLNKMKSDFLANMSHEIRTPFNAIVGYSDMIDESIENGDFDALKELMDSMREVLDRALNLFTNIVEVSQIEMGEIELDKVELDCNHVVKNAYHKKSEEAARKNLEFSVNLCEGECIIEVDWVKLEKILHSLLDNSIKYTKEGYVSISTIKHPDKIEILISDSGVGIADENIERLLKPFTQEVEGYTRPFEGAGLGLTLAYKLTQALGGDFNIESSKNKGTDIRIYFPLLNSYRRESE